MNEPLDTSCRDLPIGVQSPDIIDANQLSFQHSLAVTDDPNSVRLTWTDLEGAGGFDPSLNQQGGYNSASGDLRYGIGVRVDTGKSAVPKTPQTASSCQRPSQSPSAPPI